MRRIELETLAIDISDRVKAGNPMEDSRVELKAEWPSDSRRAARRLAGHANASRGEPVLWIIGLDQNRGIVGADFAELANWWPAVKSHFDGAAPTLALDVNARAHDKTLAVLYFETDLAPYVVKTGQAGEVSHEVPWREGTRVQSSRREDLLRILHPIMRLPKVDLLEAVIRVVPDAGNSRTHVEVEVQVTPALADSLVIPSHRCSVKFKPHGSEVWVDAGRVEVTPAAGTSPNLTWSGREAVFKGPAVAQVRTTHYHPGTPVLRNDLHADLTITLGAAGTDRAIRFERSLPPAREQHSGEWCRWVL